ncbi:MAG: FAD-dependent oxidoreductase [Rhodocyclaceae bacterium]|nr:FAD-dependent oxidoreductase [Rhodocyclaceae bacterium]MBX3668339.1 FAD-dependent oxidoreductase [Rhodocyclaceae bacterium]
MSVALERKVAASGVTAEAEAAYSEQPRDMAWVARNIPCQHACPAGTNVPAYIRAIAEGRHGDAYEINREANVLPGVLGRICSRPCESACRHGWPGNGESVGICNLKRSAADLKQAGHRITERLYGPTGKRVAIVGAGPAGIAAAHDLSMLGHEVALFERENQPGGMLRYGIPDFRLPRDILHVELRNALRLGVALYLGQGVGQGSEQPVARLLQDYDAVLLTAGCMAPLPLPLAGEWKGRDPAEICPDVEHGLPFLMALHRGETKSVRSRVAVVGAGFTALDCARVATRLGAQEVIIHIRTAEEYIPVTKEEIFEAKREGVRIRGLRTPVGIELDADGRLTGVRFVQNRLGGWREGGRRVAIPIEGSEFVERCDTLLIAIGQKTVNDFLDLPVELDRWQNVRVDADGMSSVRGLFAAGDYVSGPTTVVEAIGRGRECAMKLDTWLMGRPRRKRVVKIVPVAAPLRERQFDFIPRQEMPTAVLAERNQSRTMEVELGLSGEGCKEEAKRCYLCNLRYQIDVDRCIYCRACIDVAPRACIKLVSGIDVAADGSSETLHEAKEWNQVGAIWIDNNECIRCGACFKACPVQCITITRNELAEVDL